jgi:hypothetical protein
MTNAHRANNTGKASPTPDERYSDSTENFEMARLFDKECKAILAGVRDEEELPRAIGVKQPKTPHSSAPTPTPK